MAAAAPTECTEQCEKEKEIKKFKNLRRGKKSNITKRIAEIRKLVAEKGSRTLIDGLLKLLVKALDNARIDNEKVLELTEYAIEDTEWINDVELVVDNCKVEVEEYFESRKDDAPSSTASRTKEWVDQSRAIEKDETLSEPNSDVSQLAATLRNLSTSNGAVLRKGRSSTPIPDSLQPSSSRTYNVSSLPKRSDRFPPAFSSWRENDMLGLPKETSNATRGFSLNPLTKEPFFKLFPHDHGGDTFSHELVYPSENELGNELESVPEHIRHGQINDQCRLTDVPQEYMSDDGKKGGQHQIMKDSLLKSTPEDEDDQLKDISVRLRPTLQKPYPAQDLPSNLPVGKGQARHQHEKYQNQHDGYQYQNNQNNEHEHEHGHSQHEHGYIQHGYGQSQRRNGRDQHRYGQSQHQNGQDQHQNGQSQHQNRQNQHQYDRNQHQCDQYQHQYVRDQPHHDFDQNQCQHQHGRIQCQHGQGQDNQNQYQQQDRHQGGQHLQHQVFHQNPNQLNQHQGKPGFNSNQPHQINLENEVDSWIDRLDINRPTRHITNPALGGIGSNVAMAWLVQQNLPQAELPEFDGSALKWVTFITRFRDIVHNQEYLNDTQRHLYLTQKLVGQAERAVKGFPSDTRGYVLSLQRLKFYFGQKSKITQATLKLVTQGDAVNNDDIGSLEEFYYQISDCLVTMQMLRYEADLRSTQTLQQAVDRLPSKMTAKWAEHSLRIRSRAEEPTLIHLAEWLQQRILAMTDASLPERSKPKKGGGGGGNNARIHATFISKSTLCQICEEKHNFWKCPLYQGFSPAQRYEYTKKLKACTNCCGEGHSFKKCPSQGTCFVQGCKQRHHTTLHEYFLTKKPKKQEGNDQSDKKDSKDKSNLKHKKDSKDKNRLKDNEDPKDKKDRRNKDLSEESNKNIESAKKEEQESSNLKVQKQLSTNHVASGKDTYLFVVPVTLVGPDGQTVDTYAMLDNGSTDTMMRDEIANQLKLKGREENVNVGTVLDQKKESVEGRTVSLSVSARDGTNSTKIKNAFVVPSNKFNMPAQPRPPDPSQSDLFSQLNGIELSEVQPEEISILIGADAPAAHIHLDAKCGNNDEILAVHTMFGWTLFGKATQKKPIMKSAFINHIKVSAIKSSPPAQAADKQIDKWLLPKLWEDRNHTKSITTNLLNCSCDSTLHAELERFWQQESLAILPAKEPAMSREDTKALAKLEAETVFSEGRYTVPMLRKSLSLLPSEPMAKKRWNFLRKRFCRDPDIFDKCRTQIVDYFRKGYARRMSPAEARITTPKTWYLPHHPVVSPKKPGKVRVVFDAAAEVNKISLNKSLISGPDLLNRMDGVLMRFRNGRVAIAADIEAYYHQVRVPEEDADSLRFF